MCLRWLWQPTRKEVSEEEQATGWAGKSQVPLLTLLSLVGAHFGEGWAGPGVRQPRGEG